VLADEKRRKLGKKINVRAQCGRTARTTDSGRSKNGLELRLALFHGAGRTRGYSLPFGPPFRATLFSISRKMTRMAKLSARKNCVTRAFEHDAKGIPWAKWNCRDINMVHLLDVIAIITETRDILHLKRN